MTERQKEIARAIALGEATQGIARRLGIGPKTVQYHLTNLFDETGTWWQVQLAGWCVAHGLVTLDELQKVYCNDEVGARAVR